MEPFTVSTTIQKPREQVYEYLLDIANHAEFSDHYLVDWHLTRTDYGAGAGARLPEQGAAAAVRLGRHGASPRCEPPFKIVEHGRGGKYNRIRMLGGTYTLSPASGGATKVRANTRSRPSRRSCRTS